MTISWVKPIIFEGHHVRLEPMADRHAAGLYEAAKDPSIWEWLTIKPPANVEETRLFIHEALKGREASTELPFVVIEKKSGLIVGTTRYLDIRPADLAIEIGWTLYSVRVQRTAVNTECKLLLMTHAFEELKANRVQLKTDSRNLKSQAAIARLGAVKEGVLRKDKVLKRDGYIRDSVYFSVIREEWPAVKLRLRTMLEKK